MIDPKLKSQYSVAVVQELEQTLKEIGKIKPIWDEECQEYSFSHPDYQSIEAPGDTPEEVVHTYHRLLAKFLFERLNNNLAPHVEKMTSGRGGKRSGAGRPKSEPTLTIRLPADIAAWLKANPEHVEQVRRMMA